jgi:hypothetical protein
MNRIQITFIPTHEPEGEIIPATTRALDSSRKFEIASFNSETKRFSYKHKVVLVKKGAILQVLSKDKDGRITQALPENAFDLAIQPVVITLVDVNKDGLNYVLQIQSGRLEDAKNKIILSDRYNPQLQIVEVLTIQNDISTKGLGFIGVDDIRIGLAAQFFNKPGTPFEVSFDGKNVAFAF